MKRKTSDTPSQIWSFGARAPRCNADLFYEQLREGHRYRNALVAVERKSRQDFRDARAPIADNDAEYQRINLVCQGLDEELAQVRAQIKAHRVQSRARFAPTSLKAQADKLKAELKEQRAARKAVVSRINKAFAATFDDTRNSAEKAARKESPLFWGTKGLVEQAHEAVKKKKGEDPEFRRRGPYGHHATHLTRSGIDPELGCYEGRVGIQVKRKQIGSERFPYTVADVFAGRCPQVQLDPIPASAYATRQSAKKAYTTARLRVGSEGPAGRTPIWAEFPVLIHRQLPSDAIVKWAWVKVESHGRRLVHKFQLSLEHHSFARVPAPQGTIAVNLGWRQLKTGDIRVGYGIDDRGKRRQFILPEQIKNTTNHARSIESIRGKEFNVAHAALCAWFKANASLPEWLEDMRQHVHLWKSKNRLALLVWDWRTRRFDGDEPIFATLEQWRRRDRHLLDIASGERQHAINRRKAIFQQWGKELRQHYATVIFDDADHAKMNQRPAPEETETQEKPQRRNKAVGAAATFRAWVKQSHACALVGPSLDITANHHACGQPYAADGAKLVQFCERCNVEFDLDENAAINLLRWQLEGGGNEKDVDTLAAA